MPYDVDLLPAARCQYARLEVQVKAAVLRELRKLKDDPRHAGVAPVRRLPGALRVRAWDMRIVFEIDDARRRVKVSRIAPRDKAYRP